MSSELLVQVELEDTHDDVHDTLADPEIVADFAYLVDQLFVSVDPGKISPKHMVKGEENRRKEVVNRFQDKPKYLAFFCILVFFVLRVVSKKLEYCPEDLELLKEPKGPSRKAQLPSSFCKKGIVEFNRPFFRLLVCEYPFYKRRQYPS